MSFLFRMVPVLAMLLVSAGAAEAVTGYECKISMVGGSRADLPETIYIAVPDPAWNVVIADEFTDAAGGVVEAEVLNRSKDRLTFNWQLDLPKPKIGIATTTFSMTLFTARGEATISSLWGRSHKGAMANGIGTCRRVKL